jgi:superfamily II DNA/RNA helicase
VERLAALDGFKQGKVQLLVATDIAARGLDIVELPCVFNFELPYSPEDYVHRIGRTGRAGASGLAVSLVSHEEDKLLVAIRRFINRDLVEIPLPEIESHRPAYTASPSIPAVASLAVEQPDAPASQAPWNSRTRREPVCALLMPPVRPPQQAQA